MNRGVAVVARASRPCVSIRTGETPVPLPSSWKATSKPTGPSGLQRTHMKKCCRSKARTHEQESHSRSQGFQVPPETLSSFGGKATFCELSGPGTLVRLVQFGKRTYDGLELRNSRVSGEFWFEEALLLNLMCQARSELMRQLSLTEPSRR